MEFRLEDGAYTPHNICFSPADKDKKEKKKVKQKKKKKKKKEKKEKKTR